MSVVERQEAIRRCAARCGRLVGRRKRGVRIGSGSGSDRWGCLERGRGCRGGGIPGGWV